jgi:uncharacterized protein YndB with AHSA1/START domain
VARTHRAVVRVVVRVDIDAPVERVWQALCDPAEVTAWDGAQPLDVPPGYPKAGQHARWRVAIGRVPVVLHDRVVAVEPPRRLAARITYGIVDLDEEYRLEESGNTTILTSDNVVRARVPGLRGLATRTTQRAVHDALDRLRDHCNQVGGSNTSST